MVAAFWRSDNDPYQENDVTDDADDAIGHDAGSEFEVLEHENENEEHSSVKQWNSNGLLSNQTIPLYANEFEIKKAQKQEV